MVLCDFGLGLGNIGDLMAPILPARLVRVRIERCAALGARIRIQRDYL